MVEYVQLLTTVGKREDAERIARRLVEERLAACVQIVGPITSVYRWRGRVEVSEEWLCLAKTERGLYEEAERAIRELHPYELPEIIALPVAAGSKEYLEWVSREVRRGPSAQDI